MPQNLPERYFLGRQGRVMWPSFFANVHFCFLRDRLQQLIASQKDRLPAYDFDTDWKQMPMSYQLKTWY
jgi:hypothetical protein